MSTFSEAQLPPSFMNAVTSLSPDLIVLRSSITNIEEINRWVKEYGRLSNTKWNARTSRPVSKMFVCSKKFVCHHSSFMKVPPEENKRNISKNSGCTAAINVKVKLNSATTRRRDRFIMMGLFAVVTIYDTHNHSLNSAEVLKFLPSTDCRETFHQYFKDGMSVIKACNHHKEMLRRGENVTEEDMSNNQINPPYRAVQYWYDKWRLQNVGPRIGIGTRTRGSKFAAPVQPPAGVSSSVEGNSTSEKQKTIPVESVVVVKKEPADPTPSTSNNTDKEEFILPHLQSSWTTPDSRLSVDNEPVVSDGGQLKKKQRTDSSASTSVSDSSVVLNHTVLSQSISNISSSSNHCKNQFEGFGNYVADKLNCLDAQSALRAQKAIESILLEAEMGKYLDETQDIKPSIVPF